VSDELRQVLDIKAQRAGDVLFQQREAVGVANAIVLDALGQPAAQLAWR
jgi:hypothetical protein